MSLPDFLIIGAMKCGTTTLQAQLAAQAGLFMTTPKEPNFFSDDEIFAQGMGWYQGLFSAAAKGDLKGEASTHYTKLPTYPKTAERMAAVLKAPKLIYMVRNPIDRAISHYIHEWTEARMGRDPVAAFAEHSEMADYGCYGMQIFPFIETFGAENVHLTSLEQLTAAPQAELTAIGAFLGLDRPPIWQADLGAQNVSAERIRQFPMRRLFLANPIARSLRRALIPKALRSRIRQTRSIGTRPELPDELRRSLEARFLADSGELARLFPNHPALRLCYPFAA